MEDARALHAAFIVMALAVFLPSPPAALAGQAAAGQKDTDVLKNIRLSNLMPATKLLGHCRLLLPCRQVASDP